MTVSAPVLETMLVGKWHVPFKQTPQDLAVMTCSGWQAGQQQARLQMQAHFMNRMEREAIEETSEEVMKQIGRMFMHAPMTLLDVLMTVMPSATYPTFRRLSQWISYCIHQVQLNLWAHRYITKLFEINRLPLDTSRMYTDGQDSISEWFPQIDGPIQRFMIHSHAVMMRQCGQIRVGSPPEMEMANKAPHFLPMPPLPGQEPAVVHEQEDNLALQQWQWGSTQLVERLLQTRQPEALTRLRARIAIMSAPGSAHACLDGPAQKGVMMTHFKSDLFA